jgi:hypothetical protein
MWLLFLLIFFISLLGDTSPEGQWLAESDGTYGAGGEVDGAVAMAMYGSME